VKKYLLKTYRKKFLVDTITPVSVYLGIRDKFHNSLLLESSDYNSNNNGFSQQMRKKFRSKVLETTVDRLTEVAQKYLTTGCKKSILSNKNSEKELSSLDFEINRV